MVSIAIGRGLTIGTTKAAEASFLTFHQYLTAAWSTGALDPCILCERKKMKSEKAYITDPRIVCEEFIQRHSIVMTEIVQQELLVIYWTVRTKLEVDQEVGLYANNSVAQNEPTWGLLRSMLDRTFEHAEASIVSYLTGSPASSEVISRTAVESALNILYIIKGDRVSRLYQYFTHYFENEEKEIARWLTLTSSMDEADAAVQRSAAQKKRTALKSLQGFIDKATLELGLKVLEKRKWPNIAERFKLLGLELDHRTIYAAMCSQTHNDAEDLLNYFVFVSLGDKDLLNKVALETINFSRLLIYSGIRYYIKAAISYAECFGMTMAVKRLEYGDKALSKVLNLIALNAQ